MNIIKNYYRELLEKWNPYSNERFVYMAGPDQPPEPEAKKPKTEDAEAEKGPKSAKELVDEMNAKHKKLTEKYAETTSEGGVKITPEEQKALDDYQTKIDKITADYARLASELQTEQDPSDKAAKEVQDGAQKLIDEMKARIAGKKPEAEAGGEKMKPETKTADEKKDKTPESKEKEEVIATIKPEEKPAIAKALITELGIKSENKKILTLIEGEIDNLKLNTDQVNRFREGRVIEPTPEQKKVILAKLAEENLKPQSQEEFKLLKEFSDGSDIEDFFDDFDDPAFVYISQRHEISLPSEEKAKAGYKLKIDNKLIREPRQLVHFLPKDEAFQEKFNRASKGEAESSEIEEIKKTLENENDAAKTVMEIQKRLLTKPEGMKLSNWTALFSTIMQLVAAVQRAFETKDMDTLHDFLNDLRDVKNNPAELAKRVDASREAYKKHLEEAVPKPGLADLISMYTKPRGEKANEFFGKGLAQQEIKMHPLGKYRMEAKPAITNYLAKALNLNAVTAIRQEAGRTTITATTTEGNTVDIDLLSLEAGKKPQVRILPYSYSVNKSGEEEFGRPSGLTIQKAPEKYPIENLDMADLRARFGGTNIPEGGEKGAPENKSDKPGTTPPARQKPSPPPRPPAGPPAQPQGQKPVPKPTDAPPPTTPEKPAEPNQDQTEDTEPAPVDPVNPTIPPLKPLPPLQTPDLTQGTGWDANRGKDNPLGIPPLRNPAE